MSSAMPPTPPPSCNPEQPEPPGHAKATFESALGRPTAEREAGIAHARGDDTVLIGEVRGLLAAHEDAGDFPKNCAAPPPEVQAERDGDFIGHYWLIEKLGEGGFGAVWRAEQREPIHREVALKVIKPGMDSREIIARFEAEKQALALMEHPNIAGVLDAGTTRNGRPYFVMELVKGAPITDFADTRKLTIRERLELFIPVCHAVQHAHQKAILHRDLKPSNILIAEVDGKPVPKVIDFGIAKALGTSPEAALRESLHLTQTGAFIGTPRYMSPEQAGAKPDLDTRSDIYTLGVILFELLTGDTPLSAQTLRSAALDEMLRMIRESEPPRPSSRVATATEIVRKSATTRGTEPGRLTRTLRGDLDWITLRALEKDRERRYGSAAALAADIARHLHSEPVEAGPPSALYRFRKLVRRNRLAFAASAAIILLLVGGIAASMWQAARAMKAEKIAKGEKQRADEEAAITKAVNEFLQHDLLVQAGSRAQADSGAAPNPNLTVREALDRAAARIENRFRERPFVEAAIRATIGDSYNELGHFEKALPHLRRAIAVRTELLGAEHPLTLANRNNMALVLGNLGRYAEAERELRDLLTITTRVLGEEHPDTMKNRNNLAITFGGQGRHAEAEREQRAVLAVNTRILGEEHAITLGNRESLAVTLHEQGKVSDAEREYRAVLAIRERTLGSEHPDTLGSRSNLASNLDSQNRRAEAEAEKRAVMAAFERTHGADHPSTLIARTNFANALREQDRLVEAEKEYRALLPIMERVLGPAHPHTLTTRTGLAKALQSQRKFTEAEKEHRAVLAVRERILGSEHPDTLKTRSAIADLLDTEGNAAEAEREHRSLLAIRGRILGPEHPDTLKSRSNLANTLLALGKAGEAEAEHRAVLEILERILGPEHPETLRSRNNLGLALSGVGKFDEAEKEHRRVLEIREHSLGSEHRETLTARNNLANAFFNQMRFADAEQEYRTVLEIRGRTLRPDHPDLLLARSNLAATLGALGQHAGAERELRAILAFQERDLRQGHPDLLITYFNLAKAIEGQERRAEALPLARRAWEGWKNTVGESHAYTLKAKAMLERLDDRSPSPSPAATPPPPKVTPAKSDIKSLEEALERTRAAKGPEAAETIAAMITLAAAHGAEKNGRKAIALGEDALALARRVLPAGDQRTADAMKALIPLYRLVDLAQEARRLEAELQALPKATQKDGAKPGNP